VDTRKAPRSFAVALSIGLALALAVFAPHALAQNKAEATAKALQRKAMDEDYLATEFGKAQDKLEKAIAQCEGKCSAPLRAQLKRDLGVVQIGGEINREAGIQNLAEALQLDPSVQLDPDLKTKELEAAFAEAKKGGAGAGGAAGGGGSDDQPSGDFEHEPAAAQQIRTPIPVYAEYEGEEQLTRVIVRYKGFGMTDWKTVELRKMGEKGWGAVLPCADVQQGTSQYYMQGFNADNDVVATSGDRNNPYKVPVTREAVDEPPHLPGQQPPKQCADTGDCPPGFPGCKKAGAAAEEPVGKEGGAFCEEDDECQSGTCTVDNKCTEPKGKAKMKRWWVGVAGAVDFAFVPSADDVCKLRPFPEPDEPINDKNYYCVNKEGEDYPYRLTDPSGADRDTHPRGRENDNLVVGQSDKVDGGTALGNIRVMATLDYALNANVLLGARLGFVLNTYPGEAASVDGKAFAPIHLELRGTYLFGEDALAKAGLAPYVFGGVGISTFESSVEVSVVEQQDGQLRGDKVDAWHLAGPAFVALGGGVRYAILNPALAVMGGLRANFAFGNAFAPSVGPELGVQFGF
jgi:hypothetical protein